MFRLGRALVVLVAVALIAVACSGDAAEPPGPVDYEVIEVTELGDSGDLRVFLSPDGAHGLLGQPGADAMCFAGLFTSRDACFDEANAGITFSLDWHEDGHRAVFSQPLNPDVFLVDAELGTTQVLTEDGVWGQIEDPIRDFSPVWVGDEIVALRDETLIVVSDSERVLAEVGLVPGNYIVAGDDAVWTVGGARRPDLVVTIKRVEMDGSVQEWTVDPPDVRAAVPDPDTAPFSGPLLPLGVTERDELILFNGVPLTVTQVPDATGSTSGLWMFDGDGQPEPLFTDGTVENHIAGSFVAYAPWDDTITYVWLDTSPVGEPVARVSRIAASTDWPVHPSAGDVLYEAAPGVAVFASLPIGLPINAANQVAIVEDGIWKLIEFG